MVLGRNRVVRLILVWALLTLAWCAFVVVLAGRLHAQEPCPPGTISVDRYGFLCLPGTAEAFGDVAAARLVSFEDARGSAPVHRFTGYGPFLSAAATPRIILAHQKLASDAWIDKSKNKKGERCCDSGKDCWSIVPERVKPTEGGVNVTLDDGEIMFVPGPEILPSEDGRYWMCAWGGKRRCFFAPYSGS